MNSTLEHRKNPAEQVDAFEIVKALWGGKRVILACVCISLAIAVGYLWLTHPVFEAQTAVRPPAANAVAALNATRQANGGSEMPFTSESVYKIFLRNLKSESLRQRFFDELYLPSLSAEERAGSQTVLYSTFQKTLSIISPAPDLSIRPTDPLPPSRPTQLRFFSYESSRAVDWLQNYLEWADRATKAELIDSVTSENRIAADNLSEQISRLRSSAAASRADALLRLREALQVAQSTGLDKPSAARIKDDAVQAAGDTHDSLAYLRGAQSLRAEIAALQARVSDDPFIPGLRGLQAKESYLRAVAVDPGSIRVYSVDGVVKVLDRPVKPQKLLILVFGLVAGLLLGCLIITGRHFIADLAVRRPYER